MMMLLRRLPACRGQAHRTPVMRSRTIDGELSAQLFFKCENLQRMGAFKFRGAFNALSRFDARQRQSGVVTFSSGNHAAGDRVIGTSARHDGNDHHAERRAGGQSGCHAWLWRQCRVVRPFYRRPRTDRDLAEKHGMTLIPPYDHPDVIAGQGTAAKELIEDVGDLDALFVCLAAVVCFSGSALAVRALSPRCKIYGVEPEAGNDGQQSFRSGKIVHIDTPKTIADGAQTQHLGAYPFEIIRRDVDDILTVTDPELIDAMRFFRHAHEAACRADRMFIACRRAFDESATQGDACGRHHQRRQR